MLRNELYTLEQLGGGPAEGAARCFRVRLNAAHPLFAGHFPGQPVLPGVCTLDMVREALSEAVGRPCRFAAPVDPRLTQQLEISLRADAGRIDATVTDRERTVLKLKASYTDLHV